MKIGQVEKREALSFFHAEMSRETLRQTARFIREYADSFIWKEPVQIIFHGGEPLMMSGSWLEGACEVLDGRAGQIVGSVSKAVSSDLSENPADKKKRFLSLREGKRVGKKTDGLHGFGA